MEKIIGLNDNQVKESFERSGTNKLTELAREGFWDKFRDNLGDPMIKILCVALVLNIVFVFMGYAEWYETVGIAVAVALATLVSTFSEYRNENTFQKLQAEASQIKCKVYRNGIIIEIPIDDIVTDDCVLMQSGDLVPVDGVLISGELKVSQATLNGETKEAPKRVMPDDHVEQIAEMDLYSEFKLFRGSVVCSGNAVMCATAVGDHTVYGQLAKEVQVKEDRDTPLKIKLSGLANNISVFGYIGGVLIAVALLFQRIVIHNSFDIAQILAYCSDWGILIHDIVQAVILAVIIIVMAVPEGLPLMIAIVSAMNMGKMLRDHVLVRKIAGIETAGSLNILFSDKTGTITKGKLEAVVFVDGAGKEYKSFGEVRNELGKLLSLSIHHNTNSVISGEGSDIKIIGGNATERAILGFAAGRDNPDLSAGVVHSIPFNSENKYSASYVEGDYNLTLIKGAPEKILVRCGSFFDSNGKKLPLKSAGIIEDKINVLAKKAIRVVALAVSEKEIQGDALPEGDTWTLVGVIGIRDEVRPEAVSAIKQVQDAGIQVVMITGDRLDTAAAIATEASLLAEKDDIILTSDELREMSDDELKAKLKKIRVIARALPSDKSRLVRIAQSLDLVVGMTGDGVNDSPALKKADVGFAMGSGTEVAKEAGDIVIMNDNFLSIGKAILFGRTIFNSIRKFIIFQLTINVGAVLVSFVMPLLGRENPLSITQILWVNLVMDTLAALAFGGEPALERYMNEKPKRRTEHIVSKYMWSSILTGSIWVFAVSLFMLLSQLSVSRFRPSGDEAYLLTGYFTFFIFVSVFNAFNARTEKANLFDNITQNKGFIRIIALIVIIQVLMVYLGGVIFRCYGLTFSEWVFVLLLAITIIPVDIIRKAIWE